MHRIPDSPNTQEGPVMRHCTPNNTPTPGSFLIQHPSNRSLVFDLGVRPDWQKLPPPIVAQVTSGLSGELHVEKGVRQILEDGGFNASKLEAVVWSHWHFDHVSVHISNS
jgi:glyoxylase-like metal-dependent hydrolase (beta-lactamase superfamily II)